jgi:hypothetical protein
VKESSSKLNPRQKRSVAGVLRRRKNITRKTLSCIIYRNNNMAGRNTNFNQNRRNRREGRRSPNSKTFLERDSPSPPSNFQVFDNNFERSSPIFIQSRGSPSDSEDEGILPYAGAKFNSPPPANVLPTPPMSWLETSRTEQVALNAMSTHLRQLLKVSA